MAGTTVQEYDIKFKFHSSVKKVEQLESKLAKLRERQLTNVEKVKNSVKRTSLWMDEYKSDVAKSAQLRFQESVLAAKTADEVRDIVANERQRVRVAKQLTREKKKQSFILFYQVLVQ